LAPLELEPRIRLIEILTSMGRLEEALRQYMDFAEVYYNLADLEKARQTYEQALQLAQQSRVNPEWQARILYRIADINLQSLDWRQAVRIYEQIRALQPDDEKARLNLIDLSFRLGQESRALSEVDNYLAFLESKGLAEQCVRFLESLVGEYPSQVGLRRRLAEWYHKNGRKQDAIAQLDTIGEMLLQAGDVSGAMQVVEAILALGPDNASEYRQLLSQLRAQKR
jgi:tetratricopeptide (TPR) repeat protein